MKPRSRPGSALIGCLIFGTLGGCADGSSPLHPPAPVEAPSLVSENSDLEALPLREPLVAPNFEDLPVDELLATPMLRDSSFMEEVQEWVGFWTTSASSWFPDYLSRMKWFEGTVDSTLALHDLPQSLRYLPVIESGYSPVAVSPANAVGLWQFMAPTAKDLGMEVTALVDERRDPLRSTEAAAVFLGELYEEFDSWFLALAAYNSGPGRVRRLLIRHAPLEPRTDRLYWELRRYLPKETREFLPKLFGAIVVAGNPTSHGYDLPAQDPFSFDQVWVPDATTLDVIAKASESADTEISRLNPQYVRGMTPPLRQVSVRVPKGKGDLFSRNYALIPVDERVSFVEHIVAPGETLSHIAVLYRVSVPDLRAANPTIRPRYLRIGAMITVPVSAGLKRDSKPGS